MRKIIVYNLVTVDGLFTGLNGQLDWHNYDAEMGEHSKEQMKTLGALIFGKTTYDLMASYWRTPEAAKSEPLVAEIMNSIPKIVFSKSLKVETDDGKWKNVTILREINQAEITKMKEGEGGDIAIFGSGTIVQQFTNLDLIDEYRLVVNPLILAQGKQLFKDILNQHKLKLINTKIFKNGNVLVCYESLKK